MKTEQQIIDDIFQMVKHDRFGHVISGHVYKNGTRPRDSQLEDIVVILTTADAHYQIQNGYITILCYVPDIQPYANGVYVKDGCRLVELEYVAKTFAESLTCAVSNYNFTISRLVSIAIEEIHQHAVSLQLSFRYACNEENDNRPVLATEDEELLVTGCAYLLEDALIELNV